MDDVFNPSTSLSTRTQRREPTTIARDEIIERESQSSGGSSQTPQQVMTWKEQLTIDGKWKVEEELAQKISQRDGPSRIVPVAKWIITILLGSAITTLFITTKLSFIVLSLALNMTVPAAGPGSRDIGHTSQFLVIYLLIAVPYFLLFLRAVWTGLFAQEAPWPRKSAILCGLVIGILEPLGMVILALKVLPRVSLPVGILLMSSVIALSIFVETVKRLRQQERTAVIISLVVSCVFMLAGLSITAYMVYNQVKDSVYMVRDILHTAFGVICLNIAWLPWLLRLTSQVPPVLDEHTGGFPRSSASSSTTGIGETLENSLERSFRMTTLPRRRDIRNKVDKDATWKASFIIYGVKTLTTFIVSFIFFYVDSESITDNFSREAHSVFLSAWKFQKVLGFTWTAFGVNLIGALVCYILVFIVSHTNMQRGCLAIPVVLSLPLTVVLTAVNGACETFIKNDTICRSDSTAWYFLFLATICITLAQILSFGRHAFRKEKIYLQQEEKLFWVPGYNGASVDTWLLLDRRQTIKEGQTPGKSKSKSGKTRVYICTTMYREDKGEMQQLLESLAKINVAQTQGETFFESHIIFDGGVVQEKLSEFSLILISLLEETLGISPVTGTKIITPYGMKLSWGLPTSEGKPQMTFNIHLKDNTLVKNKKRWSQIMYMSYVLDFLSDTASDDEGLYILTTDADVMFTTESVEALLDLMSRDPTIGAVCARTHPMGNGPLVWFQTFEYAVGHWFQKAAEHVLGSVLCAPGCFSVYRCRALRDILPKYCKKVESSFDFLTKDMGEDRWLCTLMVQSGWRIEYCAASENSTNCPSEFEEFFKQRRRWIASTLANLMLIIKEWRYIALFNNRVSVMFLLYQVALLISTIIAPSTVILFVAGGLVFAWQVNAIVAVLLQIILCTLYAAACILTAPKTQILLAKMYTFIYAVIMCAVAVGTAQQIVSDLSTRSDPGPGNKTMTSTHKPPPQHISLDIPVSISTIYFAFLVSVFCLAGLLHPREITCLLHGVCFLLCIPSAYLVLMIYSICNLTDSSWGTREGETVSNTVKNTSWSKLFTEYFYCIFFCFKPKSKPSRGVDVETQTYITRHTSSGSVIEAPPHNSPGVNGSDVFSQLERDDVINEEGQLQTEFQTETYDGPTSVEDWLPEEFISLYAEAFRKHGFENILFIKGVTETDLKRMGIRKRGHVQFLMAEISKLPAFEIEYKVPTNVREWLEEIGLAQYIDNFQRNSIQTPKEMEILKRFDRREIEKELCIQKEGHIKRLMNAIKMLRDPSDTQQKAIKMRQDIDKIPVHYLSELNVAEHDFWSKLKVTCLEPDLKAFGIDAEIKVNLVELRNNWLMVMAVANTLWLILITTLATKGDLTLLGANPVGLLFLFIFGSLFLVQFFAMLVHRLSTLSHYIARAPYTFGKPYHTSWSFKDKADSGLNDPEDVLALRQTQQATRRALRAAEKGARRKHVNYSGSGHSSENAPLLAANSNPNYNHVI